MSQPESSIVTSQPKGNAFSENSPLVEIHLQTSQPQKSSFSFGFTKLNNVDHLIVKQRLELHEMLKGYETQNKYIITNRAGEKIYYAAEESGFFSRDWLGATRSFDIIVSETPGDAVLGIPRIETMRFHRPYRCTGCCFPCCLQEMQISRKIGPPIGSLTQNWSIGIPRFSLKNASGQTVLHIRGPLCTSSCFGTEVVFDILSKNEKDKIGQIVKKWAGIEQEMHTDADNFELDFPMELDVNAKAMLLAATFLIDFMFYESSGNCLCSARMCRLCCFL